MPRLLLSLLASLLLAACATSFNTPNAAGHYVSKPKQCVPYAREMSGITLYGDAHTWWDQAQTRYALGTVPQPGAVLVLAQTPRMTHGHVAVVKDVLGPRDITVTHSNWGSDWKTRRIIYDFARAQDVSPLNDWSQVKFWNHEGDCFGFPYAARGFIYPAPPATPFAATPPAPQSPNPSS